MSFLHNVQPARYAVSSRICPTCGTQRCLVGDDLCPYCRSAWWTQIEQESRSPSSQRRTQKHRCSRCKTSISTVSLTEYCRPCYALQTRDRDAAIFWARTLFPPKEPRYDWVILDTETTGLDCRAEIVEISIIAADGRVLLDTLVRPLNPIPQAATAIHHITDVMVAAAPTFSQVYAELVEQIQGRMVVTYNAAFDRRMVQQALQRSKLPPLSQVRWTCAMRQYARFMGEWSTKWHGYRWPRLSGGDHSALGDCRATLRLLQQMAASQLSMEENYQFLSVSEKGR